MGQIDVYNLTRDGRVLSCEVGSACSGHSVDMTTFAFPANRRKLLILLVGRAGIEPATI